MIREIIDLLSIKDPYSSHHPIPKRYRKMNAIQLALYRNKLIREGWHKDIICECQDFWPTSSEWFGTYPDNKVGLSFSKYSNRNEKWQIYFTGTDDFAMSKSFMYLDDTLNCFDALNKIRGPISVNDLLSLNFEQF